ncbi:hypothetical protein [Fictibacillus phosphorivorans]|uniref:hypothetical protein n=1 Tax=Fictibacillus phosphorivorans TaxID=1221500 RepID=UPI00203C80B5|nr:hypothetical protein [Fictibacillus phosphorivorans]MCM3774993.1 hypothetical protein [Fictibacillus phosphorivorans]
MIGNRLFTWTFYGTIAGTLLACFFYLLEKSFGISLYTFLVNIDFLPLPDSILSSFLIQYLSHIVISVVLIAAVDLFSETYRRPYLISLIINACMSFTFFPLYRLAITKPIQPPLSLPFTLWLIGHFLFAMIIGYFVSVLHKKRSAD